MGSHEQQIRIHALLDEGSIATLKDADIANCIGVDGPKRTLRIHGLGSAQNEPNSEAAA